MLIITSIFFEKSDLSFCLLHKEYFSMLVLNSSQQFFQQIPVLTNANLLAMITETNRSTPFDPLAEIRNGLNVFSLNRFSY